MTPDAWLEAWPARCAGAMTRSEFLKAIRALSVRYVERRGALPDRSPLDSAGKRAAFAGFYAPLHFVTTRAVIAGLGGPPARVRTIIDAGCGTGVASAAWASLGTAPVGIHGIDLNTWALDEARETWRALDFTGRGRRGDFVAELDRLTVSRSTPAESAGLGIILGWSLNELDANARLRAERAIVILAQRGARMLAIEPIARTVAPWWDDWAARSQAVGGRADEWRFPIALPPTLAALDREAGFTRDDLTARSLAFNWV